jgi:hypothetical protein
MWGRVGITDIDHAQLGICGFGAPGSTACRVDGATADRSVSAVTAAAAGRRG